MKVKGIVVTELLLCCWSFAGSQDYPLGVRAQAMGGSGVAFAADPEGQLLNPALPAERGEWAATVFYSHPFGIREIGLSSLCLRGRLDKIACGAAFIRLAHEYFEDQFYQLTLAHSFSFPNKRGTARLSCGLQAVLREIHILNYGKARAFVTNFGCVARLSEHFRWGAKLGNFLNARIGEAVETLPQEVCVGLGYFPKAGAVFQLDFYKESDFPLEVRGGIEYRVLAPLSLRMGISSNPDRLTCGLALWLRPAVLHVTAFSHPDLGWTQQYAVTLRK
jgi:hypothetical protein